MGELDRLLAEAKDDLEWPDHGALDVEVLTRIEPVVLRRRSRVAGLAVALSAAAILIVLLAVPATRDSLSAWLGIGAVQLEVGSEVPVGSSLELGVETDDVGSVPLAGGLKDYDRAFRDEVGRLWLVYDASDDLPEVSEGIGGLLGIFDGAAGPVIRKQVGDPTGQITLTTVLGSDAFWVEGVPHTIDLLDDGTIVTELGRTSGNALVWEQNGHTYRFETALSLDAALEFVSP
ncbi:MAG: hypothetical protein HKN07_03500 [Acidimicrobiia bacterium]|nr:hypothetical protein [Acidimicrobiia bacterium]NNF63300.1 hypothetical protein [Acidimicrobiia bacterium]